MNQQDLKEVMTTYKLLATENGVAKDTKVIFIDDHLLKSEMISYAMYYSQHIEAEARFVERGNFIELEYIHTKNGHSVCMILAKAM